MNQANIYTAFSMPSRSMHISCPSVAFPRQLQWIPLDPTRVQILDGRLFLTKPKPVHSGLRRSKTFEMSPDHIQVVSLVFDQWQHSPGSLSLMKTKRLLQTTQKTERPNLAISIFPSRLGHFMLTAFLCVADLFFTNVSRESGLYATQCQSPGCPRKFARLEWRPVQHMSGWAVFWVLHFFILVHSCRPGSVRNNHIVCSSSSQYNLLLRSRSTPLHFGAVWFPLDFVISPWNVLLTNKEFSAANMTAQRCRA